MRTLVVRFRARTISRILWAPVESLYPDLDLDEVELSELTPFAVELRYDFEFWPSRDDTTDAVSAAEHVRHAALGVLPTDAHP